jgi:hypothetical protein
MFKMLNQILDEKIPNNPIIFRFYKNAMPANVTCSIIVSQIVDLYGSISKATKMEEIMIEANVDPKIILRKFQRKMDNLL